jgi:hypothetical protein
MGTDTAESLRERVRQRYAEAARTAETGSGCGSLQPSAATRRRRSAAPH